MADSDATAPESNSRVSFRDQVARVQWRWVLLAGISAPLLSAILALAINEICSSVIYSTLSKQEVSKLLPLWRTAIEAGALLLNVLITAGAAAWATRQVSANPRLHGVCIGLTSMVTLLVLGSIFGLASSALGTAQARWNLAMLALTLGAGWLGGIQGRAALVERQALYRASQAVSAASTHHAVVAAVGEHLAGPEVSQVTLWRVVSQAEGGAPEEILLLAAWTPWEAQAQPSVLRLNAIQMPSLNHLGQKTPLLIRAHETPSSERATWERLSARSALLLPLTTSEGVLVGVLLVTSQAIRGFKRSIWRTQLIGSQVALALENLRLVEQAQQAAVLEERQRLAREIHDTLAQGFTSIVMHLEAAEGALPDEPTTVQQHLDQARQTARESLVQARRLVWALRPEHLERASLPEALERVVARWAEENGIAADVTTTGTVSPLYPEVEVTLLRAAQEALANVRKHARASQVAVTLSYMGDMVVLDVQDDGLGFDAMQIRTLPSGQVTGGFGLTAMRERADQLGGSLLVESVPGQGTTLVVEIPLPNGEQNGVTGMAPEMGEKRRE